MCCVIDLTMPGMGGRELLARLRESEPQLPVVLISGYSQDELRGGDMDVSNVAFLQKPFEMNKLASALGQVVDHMH